MTRKSLTAPLLCVGCGLLLAGCEGEDGEAFLMGLTDPDTLKDFDTGGYAYRSDLSEPDKPVFVRPYDGDPHSMTVGPARFEIVEPYKTVELHVDPALDAGRGSRRQFDPGLLFVGGLAGQVSGIIAEIKPAAQVLEEMVAEGLLREDFYYRIYVYPVIMPPLRDRRDDILPIAYHFLRQFNQAFGSKNLLGTCGRPPVPSNCDWWRKSAECRLS